MTGFLVGLAISLTISLGAIAHPRPHVSLPTTVSNCSADTVKYYVSQQMYNASEMSFLERTDFVELNAAFAGRFVPHNDSPR